MLKDCNNLNWKRNIILSDDGDGEPAVGIAGPFLPLWFEIMLVNWTTTYYNCDLVWLSLQTFLSTGFRVRFLARLGLRLTRAVNQKIWYTGVYQKTRLTKMSWLIGGVDVNIEQRVAIPSLSSLPGSNLAWNSVLRILRGIKRSK